VTNPPNPEDLRKLFSEAGIDIEKIPDEGLRVVLTKILEVTKGPPTLSLSDVLPYPIPEGQNHIDYFIDDKRIVKVRDYIQQLKAKMGSVESFVYKTSMECPDTVMNPKEIAQQQERLAITNPYLANYLSDFHQWITFYESIKNRYIWVCQFLDEIKFSYEQSVEFWTQELDEHTELFFMNQREPALNHLIEEHERDAILHYRPIRRLFDDATNHVTQLVELVQKFEKALPPLTLRKMEALKRREERVMYPVYPYGFPFGFRRKRSKGESVKP